MNAKIILPVLAVVLGCRGGQPQPPRRVRLVAVIESIHADSAGRAIHNGRPFPLVSLDSMLTELKRAMGGTIWYSWSGGPQRPRTEGQERLLAHLRASGVRVELRTDSTTYSRVIRE
jgi:hypothetical protein